MTNCDDQIKVYVSPSLCFSANVKDPSISTQHINTFIVYIVHSALLERRPKLCPARGVKCDQYVKATV